MDDILLIIDGQDFTGYIAADGGYTIERNDVDGKNAGRTMDATMHRERVAKKFKLKISCRPLTGAECRSILEAIHPEYVTVCLYDPRAGLQEGVQMYCSSVSSTYMFRKPNGTTWWKGVSFSLIER